MEKTDISLDALTPYIRKAGLQGPITWKGKTRRIYDHQWMFCTGGKAYYEADGRKYDLLPGSLLLIEPGIPHSFWLDESLPADIKWVHFDIEFRQDVYDLDAMLSSGKGHLFDEQLVDQHYLRKSYTFDGHIELPTIAVFEALDEVSHYFDQMLNAYNTHRQSWQLTARANWLKVMELLVDQLTDGKNTTNVSSPSALIKDMCAYIDNNYHNKLTRKNLGNYYGYNQDYIGKLFKGEMNKSISTYINELRIEKAKTLLMRTDLSVQNISELVGYSDVFYFSKKMKSMTGRSPSEWR